jgi:hypothetical protein
MALKQQAHQLRFLSFPSSGLGTASPKLELLHSCVPKLELGNKKQKICTQIISNDFFALSFQKICTLSRIGPD